MDKTSPLTPLQTWRGEESSVQYRGMVLAGLFVKRLTMFSIKFRCTIWMLLLGIGLFIASAAHGQDSKMADDILFYVNKHRAEIGLPKLQMDKGISEVAAKHSRQMANGTVPFGHDGFDDRVKMISKDIDHVNGFAENVAMGQMSAEAVVNLWLGSEGHRKNMEGDYRLTGIGIAPAKNGDLYFTQIFILNKEISLPAAGKK